MPYSHLHRIAREKLDSSTTHQRVTSCFSDLASGDRPDSDFSELIWENGQILLKGQSNKTRKSSSNTNTALDKEVDHVLPTLKTTHSSLSDFPLSGQSSRQIGMGSGQDDELVRWLNYPIDDYSSEFFSEFNQNSFSVPTSTAPAVKNISYGGMHLEQGNVSKSHRARVSDPSDGNANSSQQAHCENLKQNPPSTTGPLNTRIQPRPTPPTHPSNTSGVMNFSHFLRPAVFAKTKQSVDGAPSPSPSPSPMPVDKVKVNDKLSVLSCSNHLQSTLINPTNGSRGLTVKDDVKQSEGNCREDPFAMDSHRSPDQAHGRPGNEKYVEPMVATSSVGSGNGARGVSDGPKHKLKRKSRDTEESDYRSEDVEEESVGVRKPVNARGGSSTKRSRAAEVHNLSERKRRDRINEKMRALQELIPNCNKVDKASMLDEAIEYLKTLQLQVQIMSMGSGLFMPPMMLPHAMQHAHLPPFSPMNPSIGMGMGMGMGFGMGMLDMSGGSSLLQVPPTHGRQFPYPPISGQSNLPLMSGSSLQMFGPPPGHGTPMPMPMPMPHAPFIPPSTKSTIPSCSKDPTTNMTAQMPNRIAEPPQVAAQGGFEQSTAVQRHDHPPQTNGDGVMAD